MKTLWMERETFRRLDDSFNLVFTKEEPPHVVDGVSIGLVQHQQWATCKKKLFSTDNVLILWFWNHPFSPFGLVTSVWGSELWLPSTAGIVNSGGVEITQRCVLFRWSVHDEEKENSQWAISSFPASESQWLGWRKTYGEEVKGAFVFIRNFTSRRTLMHRGDSQTEQISEPLLNTPAASVWQTYE